jgi:hypothetical protein
MPMPSESDGTVSRNEGPEVQANPPARRPTSPRRFIGAGPAARVGPGRDLSKPRGDHPAKVDRRTQREKVMARLRRLPRTATLSDVVGAVLGERPVGHSQTYANVVLTQRALVRLAKLTAGRPFAPWEL